MIYFVCRNSACVGEKFHKPIIKDVYFVIFVENSVGKEVNYGTN